MPTAKVTIHGGDYDCSELVRMCYRAVGVLPYGSYMWTGNELQLLEEHGFVQRSLASPQQGDVLWRTGHTEIYLGGGMQGGARHGDYPGGIDGRQGDQDGTEVTRSAYRASDWSVLMRYEGGKTVEGIPCAIAAALVADHIIDHDAHGYSQPHRSGDGTIETVTITWDEGEDIPMKQTVTFKRPVYVRSSPSTKGMGNVCRSGGKYVRYEKGDTVTIDGVRFADGRVWGYYTGATSHKRRYVSLGTTDNAEVS